MPLRVAVLAPMPSELRPVVKRMRLTKQGEATYSGTVGVSAVTATTTGIGMTAAAGAADRALAAGADHVVVVGIAGGIGTIDIGALVVPALVASGRGEHHPVAIGAVPPAGGVWTSDELITDPTRIDQLVERGFVALDMETEAIAASCEERGVPWSVFRSISDRPADNLVDDRILGLANADGSPNTKAIATLLLTQPWRVGALRTLARGASLAARVAADAAASALEAWRG